MIYSYTDIHGYTDPVEVISKSKDEIVVKVGEEKISIHPGDEITILEDPFATDWEAPSNPTFNTMSFDELYDYTNSNVQISDHYYLPDSIGINVIRGHSK